MVGSGAVGTYLGEALRATGAEVSYAPRDLDSVVPVACDLAIVAVKAFATDAAVRTLERALAEAPGAAILTPQNGVGNEERLAAAFGADRVVSCALTVPVELVDGRGVAASSKGGIALAPVGGVAHNWLIAAFERTGVPVHVVAGYRSLKWSKLALNIVANAGCAILDMVPQRLVEHRAAFDLELRAVREVRAVMRAMNVAPIDLPRYPVRMLFAISALPYAVGRAVLSRRIAGARGTKAPSLLLDVRAGRGRTEVAALNGAVAEAAGRYGIAAPANATYARLLEEVCADPARRAALAGAPEALVAAVEATAAAASK